MPQSQAPRTRADRAFDFEKEAVATVRIRDTCTLFRGWLFDLCLRSVTLSEELRTLAALWRGQKIAYSNA